MELENPTVAVWTDAGRNDESKRRGLEAGVALDARELEPRRLAQAVSQRHAPELAVGDADRELAEVGLRVPRTQERPLEPVRAAAVAHLEFPRDVGIARQQEGWRPGKRLRGRADRHLREVRVVQPDGRAVRHDDLRRLPIVPPIPSRRGSAASHRARCLPSIRQQKMPDGPKADCRRPTLEERVAEASLHCFSRHPATFDARRRCWRSGWLLR